jgi:Zn-dependent metalloprotease
VNTTEDNGGVHINSGIPNRAFYELAIRLDGYAWEKAGLIWYKTLCDRLKPLATFEDAVRLTTAVAKELFGAAEAKAVKVAWKAVGL